MTIPDIKKVIMENAYRSNNCMRSLTIAIKYKLQIVSVALSFEKFI